ncbi:hypothetical protein [Nonomuraea dietziae]|uniref:hypothetical protein n=1 Tax=Nonomuraea dietziae TaxID=65515 RepID=UPI0033E95BA9
MRLLTIGAFAQAARLSPKALRLYDELGPLATGRGGRRVRIPVLRSGTAEAALIDRLASAAGHCVTGKSIHSVQTACEYS